MSQDLIANKYRIVREIARSNDVVYEATDATMGRRLAVKELVIPPNLTGQARRERIERFNREARATGRLSHPNIVTVFDFGEDAGRYFIAMEYLEGQTLRDMLQTRGALPVSEAVEIACQVLSALSHAHAHKVIHRDVKPDNIHMTQGGQVKLTDFGIARLTEEASLTGEGQVFGTPSYMSPEQIVGRAIDLRSDLFSVGVLLYEMLAGRKPFTGDSVVTITYNIMHAEPAPVGGISYGLEQALKRAMSKDPGMRYGSADEMRTALKNADSVPAAFFPPPPQPTGMGTFGATYGGAAPYGVSIPPPSPAPPRPAPAGAGAPMNGPFAQWGSGATANPVPAYPAPTGMGGVPPAPFPQRAPRKPMSEGAKTFLKVMAIAIVLAFGILGFVMLFLNAYDQQRTEGRDRVAAQLVQQGNDMFNADDLQGAAAKYEQALQSAPGPETARAARSNLAYTLNKLGVRAYEKGDKNTAADCFNRVVNLLTDSGQPADSKDQQNLEAAKSYLDRLSSEGGGFGTAPRPDTDTSTGAGEPNGNALLDARTAEAQQLLADGNSAARQGDMDTARDKWTRAAAAAPGTAPAMEAQTHLNETTSRPMF